MDGVTKQTVLQQQMQQAVQKINNDDEKEIQKIIDASFKGDEYSLTILGISIAEYVKQHSKQVGFADKCISFRERRIGEVVRYDKDVHTVAYMLDNDQCTTSIGSNRYVHPAEFEIAYSIDIDNSISIGKHAIDNLRKKALLKLIKVQDKAFFNLIHYVALKNDISDFNSFEEIFTNLAYNVERHRIPIGAFLLHRTASDKLVKNLIDENKAHLIEPIEDREKILAGYVGKWSNGGMIITRPNILEKDLIPSDQIYGLAKSEYIGGAPIHTDLTSVINDTQSLYFYKIMSMVIINPYTVVEGKLTGYNL